MRRFTNFKLGGVVLTLLFLLCVSGNSWGQALTAEQSVFTAVEADNLDGDTNVSYTTAKGGGTSNPAINRGEIRLYQAASGKEYGGTITISVADGFELEAVTIGSSMGTSVAYTLDDATEKSATEALGADATMTVPATGSKSITFYCMGTKSNARLYVNYLKVEYKALYTNKVLNPSLSPADGTVFNSNESLTVTATCATDGATIYYTTDGTIPTSASSVFPENGLTINETTTVKAMAAMADGSLENSDVVEATYTKLDGILYSYEFSSAVIKGEGVTSLDGIDWNLDCTWQGGTADFNNYMDGRGQQFGISSNPMATLSLSTDGIVGSIKSIKVATSGASDVEATFQVHVGGVPYGETVNLTSTSTEYEFTGNASGKIEFLWNNSSKKALYIRKIEVLYEEGEATQVSAPVFTPASGTTFTDKLTVTAACATDGATIYYTTDGNDPTTSSRVFPAEGLVIDATTTVKAMAADGTLENSEVVEATYKKVRDITNTPETAYTVAEAQDLIQAGEGLEPSVYVKGLITKIDEVEVEKYGNATYYINDTETEEGQLQVFRGYYLDGEKFTDKNQILVGDEVVVYGQLTLFGNDTPEIIDSYIHSLVTKGKPSPTFAWSAASYSVDINDAAGASYPTLTNNSDGTVSYESSDTEVATIDASTGAITLVAAGSTTITANVTATANYSAASASYTLTVVDASALGEAVAFVAEKDGVYYAMLNTISSDKLNASKATVFKGSVVTERKDLCGWYVDAEAGTIKDINGEYVAYGGSGTQVKLQSNSYKWVYEDELWKCGDNTRAMAMNADATGFGAYVLSGVGSTYPAAVTMPIVNGYHRDVTSGNYGTICLPYAVSAGDYDGVEFFSVAGKVMENGEATAIVLNEETELEAGKPYVFSATTDKLIAIYSGEAAAKEVEGNGLVGSFEGTDVTEGMYLLKDNTVKKVGSAGGHIAENRAYFDLSQMSEYTEAVGVNQRLISLGGNDGDGTTGVDGIEAEGNALVDVYTIGGVQVRSQVAASEATDGLAKGIYIVNGKKVVVK